MDAASAPAVRHRFWRLSGFQLPRTPTGVNMRSTRQLLIGLVGPSGSGKTTVCEYLEREAHFLTMHVASPLKQAYCRMFSVPVSHVARPSVDYPKEYLGGVTPRTVLEHLGTRLHEVAPMALPLSLQERVLSARSCGVSRILVDGIRRASEADMVYALGGEVWRLSGGSIDPDKPCDMSQSLARCSAVVPWMDTKEQMYGVLDRLLSNYGGSDAGHGGARA
jgi:hypothetical protein